MTSPKRGLGRGLASLIPTAPIAPTDTAAPSRTGASAQRAHDHGSGATTGIHALDTGSADTAGLAGVSGAALGAYFAEVDICAVRPNPRQPRVEFDEEALAELVHSIRVVGLLQPVVVRPRAGEFELIMGERRWRAAKAAGLERIPAIVRETADNDLLRDSLLENLHRAELNPLEEAAAYRQLLDDFGCTQETLAERIGRSRPQISNTLRLLNLPPVVQRRVAAGVLSAGHARALLAVADPAGQEQLAARVVAEGISVRALEELVTMSPRLSATPRGRRVRPALPELDGVADRLADRLDTRCRVEMGRSKGKITIEFATLDDLRRVLELLDVGTAPSG